MSRDATDQAYRPFEDLAALLKRKNLSLAGQPAPKPGRAMSREQEAGLFARAMADVTPLPPDRHYHAPIGRRPSAHAGLNGFHEVCGDEEERFTLAALRRLIDSGEGFVVSQTAEYMEAVGPGVAPEIARRLHLGRYAIQDHMDLHGLTVAQAEPAVHDFIYHAISRDFRAVLIIHGRGLTSPGKPVLKYKVFEWLTQSAMRRHVIALTSARACDGGAGATYVLLRRRKWAKRSYRTRTV